MLSPINLAEYEDPKLYDLENSDFGVDGPFILEHARKYGNPILELGCGTGRVTIPLFEHGVKITGLDIVPGMIERAKEKSRGMSIEWIVADARSFQLDRKFRFIFETGSVFQHLLTRVDQEAYLKQVYEHLEDEGYFMLGLLFPHPDFLVDVEQEKDWFKINHPDGFEIFVSGTEVYDELRQVKIETAYRRWIASDGSQITRVAPLSLRYLFPAEAQALLHYNGFEIEDCYGDNDASPLSKDSRLQIYVCKKRK